MILFIHIWNFSDLFSLLRFHYNIFIFHFNINFILYQFFISWNLLTFFILLIFLFVFLSFSRLKIVLNMRIGINIFFVDFLLLLRIDAFRRSCRSNLFFTAFNFHLGVLWNYNLNILENLFLLKRQKFLLLLLKSDWLVFEYDFLFVHFMDNLLLITKLNWGVLNVFLNIKELYVIVKRFFFFKFNLIIQLLYNLIIFFNLIIIYEILQAWWQLTPNIKLIAENLRLWRRC